MSAYIVTALGNYELEINAKSGDRFCYRDITRMNVRFSSDFRCYVMIVDVKNTIGLTVGAGCIIVAW